MKKKFFYILLNFFRFFILISILFVLFFLIAQIIDGLADYIKHHKIFIFKNYLYNCPLLFVQVSPVITMLSTMLIVSEMIKNNELKIMLISGIKPLYIFSIFLICGIFSSIVSFSVKNFLSPHLIKKINFPMPKISISFSSSNYFFYSEKIIGNIFLNVEFTEYLSEGGIITIKAKRAENYRENDWIFKEGCLWKFDREKNLIKEEKFLIKNLNIPLTSEILLISNIDVEKFSFFQLYKIIKKMGNLKLKPVSLITYLNEKISYPLLNFFMIFVIYPIFKKREKISILYVFSFSFLFSLFAYSIYIFFFSLSKNGKFPPILGSWIIHIGIMIYFFINQKEKI